MRTCTTEGCQQPQERPNYVTKCVEHRREESRRYYRTHRDTKREAARNRYWSDPERFKAFARKYREEHREQWLESARQSQRRSRLLNPDAARAKSNRWHRNNPAYGRAQRQRYRAAKASVLFRLRLDLSECALCGGPLRPDLAYPDVMSTTVGHEPPLSVAQRDGWLTVIERPEHFGCNVKKGARIDADLPKEIFQQ